MKQKSSPERCVVDEPHLLRGLASRPFDGEGIAPKAMNLVEDGVLQNWLLDTTSARQLNLWTNGRAARSGTSTSPSATNVMVAPGNVSCPDLIASTAYGILITELIGQGVNGVTGDYSRGVSGFLIENGKITYPVSEVTVAGNLRDMYGRMIFADDVDVNGAIQLPTLAVEGMIIAGA